jgi:hypothetical protein
MKDDFENFSSWLPSSFFSHGTRFEVSDPGPLQSISAKVKLLLEKISSNTKSENTYVDSSLEILID